MNKRCLPVCCLPGIILSFGGCGGESAANRPDDGVLVFAAASTTDAMEEICRRFRQEHDIEVRTSFAASSTLAQQVVNGAKAAVFVSANQRWADYLDEHAMVANRQELVGNQLVVIVPAPSRGRAVTVQKLEDLLHEKIRHVALANPESVPAGIYAKQALMKLELWERLESKIVSGADVRWALVYVERAEAEAGIVYATDAAISSSVEVALRIPFDLTGPIRYPILLLQAGSGNQAAESFYRYLSSPQAAEIFEQRGFVVLTGKRGQKAFVRGRRRAFQAKGS